MGDEPKTLSGRNGNGSGVKLATVVTVTIFMFGQFVVTLIWAIRQEGRITNSELDIIRANVTINNVAASFHSLESRIDRLDTPLSRRVDDNVKRIDAMQSRVQAQSERLQRIEVILEQLRGGGK